MKAIISSTFDDKYLFCLPIVAWSWNRLGVDVICFMPEPDNIPESHKLLVVLEAATNKYTSKGLTVNYFNAPAHKQATYSQCSRLYAAAIKDLDENEVFVTSDVDMAVFDVPPYFDYPDSFTVFGTDLVPEKQFPICYIAAKVKDWRKTFNMGDKEPQECLDELLGPIECDNMRGNYWAKDQEEAYNKIWLSAGINYANRARPGTQFADNRVDRDDAYWRQYVNSSLIDAHLWRPLYEESNFNNLMELMQTMYPNDDFSWLIQYRNDYLQFV